MSLRYQFPTYFPAIWVFILNLTGALAASPEKTDSTAWVWMGKAAAHYQKSRPLKLEFTTRTRSPQTDETRSEKGTLWIGGSGKYRLFLPGHQLISNGKAYWQYSEENKQVIVELADSSRIGSGPSLMLSKFLACRPLELKRDTKIKNQFHIRIEPTPDLDSYDSLSVVVRSPNGRPMTVYLRDPSGTEVEHRITSWKAGVKFKDGDFIFSPPKGVEVIDMRD